MIMRRRNGRRESENGHGGLAEKKRLMGKGKGFRVP